VKDQKNDVLDNTIHLKKVVLSIPMSLVIS
jgi:hypothetical protein